MSDLESMLTFWRYVHKFFSNFTSTQHRDEFDRQFFELISERSNYSTYAAFRKLLHCLNDAHTDVFPKDVIPLLSVGLKTKLIDSKCLVLNNLVQLRDSIPIGSEILLMNEEPIIEVMQNNLSQVSFSTRNHGISRVLKYLLSNRYSANPRIVINTPDGLRKEIVLESVFDLKTFPLSQSQPSFDSIKNCYSRDTSYLYIPSFANESDIELVIQELRKLASISKLIIDVRGNTGGNSVFATKLLAILTHKQLMGASWRSLSFNAFQVAYFHNLDPRQQAANASDWYVGKSETVFPDRPISVNKICVLMDCETISAAEDFLLYAKQIDNCVLIGETSAGSSGMPVNLDLGGNFWCQISAKHDFINEPHDFIRKGIKPDYEVYSTADALGNRIDEQLEFALDW